MKHPVLIVEDEPSIADTLLYVLEQEGFAPTRAATLAEAGELFGTGSFAAIILDVGLPDGNGFEFCKEIRKNHNTPILFLTSRNEEVDRIVGLEIGADDYITKPFSPREVAARLKAIFRRTSPGTTGSAVEPGAVGTRTFAVDAARRRITFHNTALELSRFEYGILSLLLRRPGQVYTRQQIMEHVWPDPDMSLDRTVDTHIKTIRNKLRQIAEGDVLITHRGVGYSLTES